MLEEPVAVTCLIIDALQALGVPYLFGGSLASAVTEASIAALGRGG